MKRMASKHVRGSSAVIGSEKGIVLIISLLVMLLLSAQGLAFLTVSATESTIAHNGIDVARAFGVAEGGLSHTRRYLSQAVATTGLDPFLAGSSGSPVPVGALQNFSAFGAGGGTYSVSVANNTTAYQGIPADPDPQDDTDNRVWITAVGMYENSARTVNALVEFNPLLNPPGAIGSFDGFDPSGPVGFDFNGNSFEVTGIDTAAPEATGTCGTPSYDKTGIVVESAPALTELDVEIASNQEDNVTGAGGNESIGIDNSLTVGQLQALKAALVPQATVTLSGNVTSNIGSPTNPVIAYATDHLDLQGNGEGYGILIVERRLRMRGTFTWEGLILLVGQGEFEIEGTAGVYGAIVAANTGAYSGNSGETRVTVKGNATVAYSSQALCRASQVMPTTLLAWRQL